MLRLHLRLKGFITYGQYTNKGNFHLYNNSTYGNTPLYYNKIFRFSVYAFRVSNVCFIMNKLMDEYKLKFRPHKNVAFALAEIYLI